MTTQLLESEQSGTFEQPYKELGLKAKHFKSVCEDVTGSLRDTSGDDVAAATDALGRGGGSAAPFVAEVGVLFKRALEEASAHPSITEFLNDEVPLLFDSPVLRKSPLFFPASQNKEKRDVADIPRRLILYSLEGEESVEAKTGGAGLSLGERFLPRESIAKFGLLFDVCETVLRQILRELETSLGLNAGVLTSLCRKGAMHAIRLLR